jgi:hypothetical protein
MKQRKIVLLLLVILLASLACTIFTGGPDFPSDAIPVSTEAVDSLREETKAAVEAGAQSGVVTLFITETQITSYLAFKFQADENPMFTDPQVYLRDGQMRIYGKAERGILSANVGIVLAVGLDDQGVPQLQLVSADFGPLPLPSGLNDAITAIIEEAYTGALGPVATGFRIVSITIADGVMSIVGQIH